MNNKLKIIYISVSLFVICIICTLCISISAYLYSELHLYDLNMPLRNTKRQELTFELSVALESYYSQNGIYPTTINFKNNTFYIGDLSVELSEEYLTPDNTTSKQGTIYCYSSYRNQFSIGSKQEIRSDENERWFILGDLNCDESDIINP